MWEPQLLATLRASTGLYRDNFTFYHSKLSPLPTLKIPKNLTFANRAWTQLPDREAATNQNNFRKEPDEMLKSASGCQVPESSEVQRGHHSPSERDRS
jgi:hypothetical protein